jgi:hypothetical protein
MLRENTAVVRPLKWLEVKDERLSNTVFHDFYNGAGDCFSPILLEKLVARNPVKVASRF